MVAGLAETMAVLVKARPSEQPGQVVRGGARARMASGIVDHTDQVQPVFQGRDGNPTSGAGNVALEKGRAPGMNPVAARAAPQEAGCCWCDILGKDLQVQVAHQCLVCERILGAVDQRGLAVVQLAGLITELRIAAGAKEAARWWEAARWDQTVEVKSTFAAVVDQH